MTDLPDLTTGAGTDVTAVNSTLQNIARNLGIAATVLANVAPVQTTTASPAATAINNLATTIATVIGTSLLRHGIIFHNPGTNNVYVFPTLATTVTTALVGGAFIIYPGGTLEFPSTVYTNITCGWSAWVATGSSQPLTVVEFF